MEILTYQQRQKQDETNDSLFYSSPKFVYHLDSNFRKNLSELYEEEIENNSSVLDIMSSWDSYLPKNIKYKKVIGHGLNKDELERNKAFDDYWIQNFNINQKIPLGDETMDFCLMVAAWQYLQYPEKIAEEIARILNKNGKFIISFSFEYVHIFGALCQKALFEKAIIILPFLFKILAISSAISSGYCKYCHAATIKQ